MQAAIGAHKDRAGLRSLVESYDPAEDEPLPPTAAEVIERRLDSARRAVGGLRFTATCHQLDADRWNVALQGSPGRDTIPVPSLPDVTTMIRPITLASLGDSLPHLDETGLRATFALSEQAVTPFFVIVHRIDDTQVAYVIAAELIDPPPDRATKVLQALLADRESLIRFLLLMLGNIDDALGHFTGSGEWSGSKARWGEGFTSEALLEPLMRAYARDPGRLRDIERLLNDLEHLADGNSVLPQGWHEIWDPIRAASGEGTTREHAHH